MQKLFNSLFDVYDLLKEMVDNGYVLSYVGFQGTFFIDKLEKKTTERGEEIIATDDLGYSLTLDIKIDDNNPINDCPVVVKTFDEDSVDFYVIAYDFCDSFVIKIDMTGERREKFLKKINDK